MKKSNDLFTPQRQSIFAIILILIKFTRMLIKQMWPLILVLIFNRGDKFEVWLGIISIGAGVLTIFGSMIAYFKFYYYIDEENLHIDKGLFNKTSLNLPFERIQSVDFEQNIIHQFFGVVQVNIDSAGTKGNEISFDALTKDQANALREYIMARKATMVSQTDDVVEEEEYEETILRLTERDLVKIGISQNHLRTAGIIFAAIWALADNIGQALNRDIYEEIGDGAEAYIEGGIIVILIAIPVFLFISFLITLIRTVFRFYDLRFIKTNRGFKLISGLITRKEKSAQKDKIQIISWATNPVRKLFGMFTLRLYQASSVDVLGGKAIMVPGCYEDQVDKTLYTVIPGIEHAQWETHGIHPLARYRFALFAGLLPCLVFTGVAIFSKNYSLLWAWLYFPLSLYMAQLYYKKRTLKLHQNYVISSSGIFSTKHKAMEIYKVQAVKLNQSFYQWRKDLATLTLYTASGDIRIPFIPIAKAKQIRDYLLYRVEHDRRKWM